MSSSRSHIAKFNDSFVNVYLLGISTSCQFLTKLREQPRKVIELIVRVQSAGAWQRPDHGPGQPIILAADHGFGTAERCNRYAPTPRKATHLAGNRRIFFSRFRAPLRYSSFDNSEAEAVARATRLVIP